MSNRKPFFRFCKSIVKIFKRKPNVLNLNGSMEDLDDCAVYLSNHSGASGPFTHEMYFPKDFRAWGTHEMCGTLKERYNYFSNIYLHQKKHINKFLAKIIAVIVVPILHLFYKGMQIIPTYTDSRLRGTLSESFAELQKGVSILIYPEDSADGYHDELTGYFAGFVLLCRQYYKKYGISLNIYNMYYSRKKNLVVIDKAVNFLDIKDRNEKEVANEFKDRANELYHTYILKDNKENTVESVQSIGNFNEVQSDIKLSVDEMNEEDKANCQ